MCDMLIYQNLTDKILVARLYIKKAIKAILTIQTWDKLIKENLTLIKEDWDSLKEMAIFFNIFKKPIIQS